MYLSPEYVAETILIDLSMCPGISEEELISRHSGFNVWLSSTYESVDNVIKFFLDTGIIRYVKHDHCPTHSDSLIISSKHLACMLRKRRIKENLAEIQRYDAKYRYGSITSTDDEYGWRPSEKITS